MSLLKDLVGDITQSSMSGLINSPANSIVNWLEWDGTKDSADVLLEPDGYAGVTDFDFISDTLVIQATRIRVGGDQLVQKRLVQLLAYDPATGLINDTPIDTLELSQADVGTYASVRYMGNNRTFIMFTQGGEFACYIISSDNNTLVEEAYNNLSSVLTPANLDPFSGIIDKFSNTELGLMIDYGSTYYLLSVDITGDAFSFGTFTNTTITQSGDNMGAACLVGSNKVVVASWDRLKLYTFSSGTWTLEDTEFITADQATYRDINIKPYGSDKVFLTFETEGGSATDETSAGVYSITGDTITRENTEVIVDVDHFLPAPFNKEVDQVGENIFLFASVFNNTNQVDAIFITINPDTFDLTATTPAEIMDGDHVAIKVVPNSNYGKVLCCSQDNTTTPTDQINYKTMIA